MKKKKKSHYIEIKKDIKAKKKKERKKEIDIPNKKKR